jgi:hypothetical protein
MSMPVATMAPARRKRLGQFFSGLPLGRLLAALAGAGEAKSIIDPMAGRGDLLRGCLEVGAEPDVLAGIEIDHAAYRQARRALPGAEIVHGSAFDPKSLHKLPTLSWDLVIGNPPFVRYQDGGGHDDGVPGAAMVRSDLAASLRLMTGLPLDDHSLLLEKVVGYSGFSDLAVPSVLLSMALVRPGGVLALVLPQTWLARNYAQPIRDCLDDLFDVQAIVEDEDARWFPDALVRTTLVVAKRRARGSPRTSLGQLRIRLGASAANGESLVGGLLSGSQQPEREFADKLQGEAELPIFEGASCRILRLESEVGHPVLSGSTSGASRGGALLDPALSQAAMSSLDEYGVDVGQGLRTGANDFFYVKPSGRSGYFIASDALGGGLVACPPSLLREAVRDQRGDQDLILDLRTVALPEDLNQWGKEASSAYRLMPPSVAAHVRHASTCLSGKPGREKRIPDLSAVRTNVRVARSGSPPRSWYMLPDFQPRHMPDVYMARVCGARPVATTTRRGVLVDANFVTFRCNGILSSQALVAILNSNWVWAWLEEAGAPMGGGALKIERTMLARLPLPKLSAIQIQDLAKIGGADSPPSPPEAADRILVSQICKEENELLKRLKAKARDRFLARTGKSL